MILFNAASGIMISDSYGEAGSRELRALAKKMRLDRDHLRSEGHPVDEHYLVPAAKHPGMAARGAEIVTADVFRLRKEAKKPGTPSVRQKPAAPARTEDGDLDTFFPRRDHDRRLQRRGPERTERLLQQSRRAA